MGGDGGSLVNHRDVFARTKKKQKTAAQLTFGVSRLLDWTHCSLTKEMLQEPICCDDLGNLYNKTSLIEAMIQKKMPMALSYIKRIKRDIIDCHVTIRDNVQSIDINHPENGGLFMCPISELIGNGKYPFVCLRKCGCVLSERALKNIKGHQCLVCGQTLDKEINEYTRIPINSSPEQKEKLFKQMMARKQKQKQDKKNKKQIGKSHDKEEKEEVNEEEEQDVDLNHNRKQKKKKQIHEKKKLNGFDKKDKRKEIEKYLTAKKKEEAISGHKRVLEAAEESVTKKMKTSHVFASIFNRKQKDFNFAGGGTGF